MEHQEAEVSDITVVLKASAAENFDASVAELTTIGMVVEQTDADNGVVEGTISAEKLAQIKTLATVEYVRVEFNYIADHPTGEASDEDSED